MRILKQIGLVFLPALLLFAAAAFAQPDFYQDIEGGQDHPLVSRFSGSVICLYEAKDFDEYLLPLGKLSFKPDTPQPYRWTKSRQLEGKVTRITYIAPLNTATLAIQRSYEAALKQAGFQVLFTGGDPDFGILYPQWYESVNPYPDFKRQYRLGRSSQRYLAAKASRDGGEIYVTVFAALGNGVYPSGYPTVQVDVIEVQPLEAGLVTAQSMAEGLQTTGRVAIYSIYFDTGKAELKPESEPTVKEIAALLQQNPRLNLYVVGHTDNVGTLGANMDLSQRRAAAVVKAVTTKYAIDSMRLRSAGVGPLAPVAPNTTDEGRAKNRRVELVAQ